MAKDKVCSKEEMLIVSAYVDGCSKAEAYVKVFGNPKGKTSATVLASQLFAREHVRKEVQRRKAEMEKASAQRSVEEMKKCQQLWSRSDSVKRLIDILDDCQRTRSEDGINKDTVQTVRLERDTVDSLNRMLGYNEAEKIEADTTVKVEMDGGLLDLV